MRRSKKLLTTSVALVAALTASALYAHDAGNSQGSRMGQGGMMHGGSGGMMNMMPMMKQMGRMMDSCNKMMQSMTHGHAPKKPNEQWQKNGPEAPEKKG